MSLPMNVLSFGLFVTAHSSCVKKHVSSLTAQWKNKNGITIEELRSKDRNKDLVKIRHVAMYLTKKFSKKTICSKLIKISFANIRFSV